MREKSDNQIYWYLFIAIVLPISFIGLGVDIYYPYRLKPYWLKSTFLLLIASPFLVIDTHILITKIKQGSVKNSTAISIYSFKGFAKKSLSN